MIFRIVPFFGQRRKDAKLPAVGETGGTEVEELDEFPRVVVMVESRGGCR